MHTSFLQKYNDGILLQAEILPNKTDGKKPRCYQKRNKRNKACPAPGQDGQLTGSAQAEENEGSSLGTFSPRAAPALRVNVSGSMTVLRSAAAQWPWGGGPMAQSLSPKAKRKWFLDSHVGSWASSQRLSPSFWVFRQPFQLLSQVLLAYICGSFHFCWCSYEISADIVSHNPIFFLPREMCFSTAITDVFLQ